MKLKLFIKIEEYREAVVLKIYSKWKAVDQVSKFSKFSFQIVKWGPFIIPLDNSHDISPIISKI